MNAELRTRNAEERDSDLPRSALRVPRLVRLPVVLTIAGSDSGGGAGIQADLKTFSGIGVFGTSAVTCITAQSPDEVRAVEPASADIVALQIETVCGAFPVTAAKTGMLYSTGIIRAVARAVKAASLSMLVVDPVMVATSGAKLLQDDAVQALLTELVPLARVVTPNVPEAEILAGHPITCRAELEKAASGIGRKYGVACAAKGGHLASAEVVDVLYADGETTVLTSPRVAAKETHGTGCTFSAAMAANLGSGCDMKNAFERARAFVSSALENALRAGEHCPLGIGRLKPVAGDLEAG